MTAVVQLGSIAQIARTVKDIKQTEAWYKDVLGLPHLFTVGTFAFFGGGVRLLRSRILRAGRSVFCRRSNPKCRRLQGTRGMRIMHVEGHR